jgi:hypothetical protein
MRYTVLVASAGAVLSAGCASKSASSAPPGTQPPPAARVNTNIISAAELEGTTFDNVATAVVILRPQWARHDIGRVSTGVPTLVYDQRELIGSFDRLKEIKVSEVKELRWLSRDEARVRFGPNAQQGIMIVRK